MGCALPLPLPPLHMTGVLCADGSSWSADLVVDCSGRGSALPSWLAAAGFKRPHTSRISAGAGYASWWVGRMMQLTAAARSVAGCGDGPSSSAAGCTGCLSFATSIEHVRKQPMPAHVSSGASHAEPQVQVLSADRSPVLVDDEDKQLLACQVAACNPPSAGRCSLQAGRTKIDVCD